MPIVATVSPRMTGALINWLTFFAHARFLGDIPTDAQIIDAWNVLRGDHGIGQVEVRLVDMQQPVAGGALN